MSHSRFAIDLPSATLGAGLLLALCLQREGSCGLVALPRDEVTVFAADVSAGLKTVEEVNAEPYGFRVTWIEWDSGFRGTGLEIGDRIVSVDGERYERERREQEVRRAIGGLQEAEHWLELGRGDDSPIQLTVQRSGRPLELSGRLRAKRTYHDANGRRTLGLGGPPATGSLKGSGAWAMWYERHTAFAEQVLDDGWQSRRLNNNRRLLQEYQDDRAPLDFLLEHHPGPFTDTVVADWNRVHASLQGQLYTVSAEDLEYRRLGEQRAAEVRAAATSARAQYIESLAGKLRPTFPAIDPTTTDHQSVVGQLVELPKISYRDFRNDLGRSIAVMGRSGDGYTFADLDSPSMQRFFATQLRYQAQVTPKLEETYRFIGRILDAPCMVTDQHRAVTGLLVEVVAASAGGDAFFVDLLETEDEVAWFAGERELRALAQGRPADDAGPGEVVQAMIRSIQYGDLQTWSQLFATWRAYPAEDGVPPYFLPTHSVAEHALQSSWQRSRRLVLGDVLDARVSEERGVRLLMAADPDNEIPKVEQAIVIVDHIGQFENEYRTFVDINVHRVWVLQRLDSGPWRIASEQSL